MCHVRSSFFPKIQGLIGNKILHQTHGEGGRGLSSIYQLVDARLLHDHQPLVGIYNNLLNSGVRAASSSRGYHVSKGNTQRGIGNNYSPPSPEDIMTEWFVATTRLLAAICAGRHENYKRVQKLLDFKVRVLFCLFERNQIN